MSLSVSRLQTSNQADATHRVRAPRRTLMPLAGALVAIGLGWLAQSLLQGDWLWEGLLVYAVAVILFVRSLRRRPAVAPPPLHSVGRGLGSEVSPTPWGAGKVGIHVGWGIAGLGVLLSLAGLVFFARGASPEGWFFYIVSLIIFAGGTWLAGRRSCESATDVRELASPEKSGGKSWHGVDPWLLAIVALALFLRLYHFHSMPFGTWYDEAIAGLDARRLLTDSAYWPVFWESMNHPAHHLYLFALGLQLFGDTIWGLRAVSVAFGVATALAAYLFGRELRGRGWGLLLAFVVATMRWDINFSRVAMNSIDVPFFVFVTLYCGLRTWRSSLRSAWWAAATGLALGLGLCFYTGFRLFAAAFLLFALVVWLRASLRSPVSDLWRRGWAVRVGLFALAVWLVVMPVVQYAVLNPATFWQRTRIVSIFTNRENPDLAVALANTVRKHALMFNYRGDPNGRHNLPGAPMLDQLSAVLFVLGIGLAASRRDRAGLFFLILLPAGLAGGVFSLDFEAPQSLRSIAALPAVAYFIVLSLATLWKEFRLSARITRPRYSLAPLALALGIIVYGNFDTYFHRQATDAAAWQAFSTAETLVGMQAAERGATPTYYFSPLLYDHPSIRFHAPTPAPGPDQPASQRKVMLLPDPLPAREAGDRPVIYFLHPDESWVVDLAREIYPNAAITELPQDSRYPTVVTMIELRPEDVTGVQGLDVRYWAGQDDTVAPLALERWPRLEGNWPADSPLPLPFVAEWTGVLYAPHYGDYHLLVTAPDALHLTLDGQSWEGTRGITVETQLAEGNHTLSIWAAGGDGELHLAWQPPEGNELQTVPQWALYSRPVTANGLLGKYYSNQDLRGEPTFERIDPTLNLYFHLTPLPRPYSVEWSGALEVPYEGVYSLGLRAVDGAQLYLDGQMILETRAPEQLHETYATLTTGLHELRITYRDTLGRSRIHLYWTRPGGEREIIPPPYLWPSAASARTAPAPPPTPPPGAEAGPLELVWLASWGASGDAEGRFNEPRDVAALDDLIYVADTGNRRIQVFDRHGQFRGAWYGGAEEEFVEPLAIAPSSDGHRLLVLDSLPGWIYRFAPDGTAIDRLAGPATGMFHPRGLSIFPPQSGGAAGDTIAVADTGGSRLMLFSADGALLGQLGEYGEAPGQFHEPTDVLRDKTAAYLVVEAYNQRVQRMDRRGASLAIWPIPASIAYDGPHLAWAPDGSLLMTSPEEGAVLRYTIDGRLLNRWNEAGGSPMRRPVGITADERGVVYVTDTVSHQVYLFQSRTEEAE